MPYILLQPIIFPFKESETGGELRQLEKTNSCFLSLKKAAKTPLWIDKIMGFLCIMMKGWDREHGDNEISVSGGKGWDGEHDDGEECDRDAMGCED